MVIFDSVTIMELYRIINELTGTVNISFISQGHDAWEFIQSLMTFAASKEGDISKAIAPL